MCKRRQEEEKHFLKVDEGLPMKTVPKTNCVWIIYIEERSLQLSPLLKGMSDVWTVQGWHSKGRSECFFISFHKRWRVREENVAQGSSGGFPQLAGSVYYLCSPVNVKTQSRMCVQLFSMLGSIHVHDYKYSIYLQWILHKYLRKHQHQK